MRNPYEREARPVIDPALLAEHNAGVAAARFSYRQNEALCAEGDCYRYRRSGLQTCQVHKNLEET